MKRREHWTKDRTGGDVLAALERSVSRWDRPAVEAAVARREEMTPLLLARLEGLLADPKAELEGEARAGFVYALILLSHFRETRAHDLVVDLFRLPEALAVPLFDGLIRENLVGFLLGTWGGDARGIRTLMDDENAYGWCRASAVDALAIAAASGEVDRDELIDDFVRILDAAIPGEHVVFTSAVGSALIDLHPDRSRRALIDAGKRLAADGWSTDAGFLDLLVARGREASMARLRSRLRTLLPDDVHRYLGQPDWFADVIDCATPPDGAVVHVSGALGTGAVVSCAPRGDCLAARRAARRRWRGRLVRAAQERNRQRASRR